MTVFDRIKLLAKERGKSLNRIEEELGLPKNVLYRMKTSDNPTKDRLETLANYFDVSVDYLLGRTDNTKATAEKKSDDLDDVLDNVMSFDGEPLDDHDREVIRAYLKGRFGK
ncbi:helix-turn-helix transcriptional regulator [Enterococcus faecalis]|uniref:helix-turn-helix domain-containing protein n=1 Tax=Enterococcus sp. AZ159 TaxID=2774867 RepID=UPI002A3FE529|nr:helix-turn-helix transcriptional regulator [Enterococcus faecalis]EKJ3567342.1 helix-turn-helix transcriptional regulator [Enterococcus faecalis]HBI2077320.1 helix-turn-helix transcriptional regulator [Enterococcus faecalis]